MSKHVHYSVGEHDPHTPFSIICSRNEARGSKTQRNYTYLVMMLNIDVSILVTVTNLPEEFRHLSSRGVVEHRLQFFRQW
jgi:hypothetical protein